MPRGPRKHKASQLRERISQFFLSLSEVPVSRMLTKGCSANSQLAGAIPVAAPFSGELRQHCRVRFSEESQVVSLSESFGLP
jgi:hypothetical protein